MSSTDQTLKDRSTTAGPTDSPTESTQSRHRLDLSPTKIIGGALAAMTAAALGAQLSVVGTVIGAALASVVAAVAGSLYTASLQRTGNRVRGVWQRGDVPVSTAMDDPEPVDAVPRPSTPAARRRLSASSVLVGALAAFGLAAAGLTAVELVTGSALSGGDGTTVSQVSGADDRPPAPADKPSPNPEPTSSVTPTSSASTEAAPAEPTEPTEPTEPIDPTSAPATTQPTVAPSSPAPTDTGTASSPAVSPTAPETAAPGT